MADAREGLECPVCLRMRGRGLGPSDHCYRNEENCAKYTLDPIARKWRARALAAEARSTPACAPLLAAMGRAATTWHALDTGPWPQSIDEEHTEDGESPEWLAYNERAIAAQNALFVAIAAYAHVPSTPTAPPVEPEQPEGRPSLSGPCPKSEDGRHVLPTRQIMQFACLACGGGL